MLVDKAVIFVKSGSGGDGAVAFRREAYAPKGGPSGGDGGDGGSFYVKATPGVDTLLDMAGRHHWYAENGQPGGGKSCSGKAGEDFILKVPPGTLVYNDETGELIVDLDTPGQTFRIAPGGKGGYGNEHFKSATKQVPRDFTPGEPGVELRIRLELKLIADIGLVGKPNAGKSTLLTAISRAKPKVADYPFTTLEPQLGIVELPGFRRIVVADIPGLIEGAADGAGLGHDFLRHIERTRILVHLLDVDPADHSDPADNFHAINAELRQYSTVLADKPMLVALNKMDLHPDPEDRAAAIELLADKIDQPMYQISAATGEGTRELFEECWQRLEQTKQENPEV